MLIDGILPGTRLCIGELGWLLNDMSLASGRLRFGQLTFQLSDALLLGQLTLQFGDALLWVVLVHL